LDLIVTAHHNHIIITANLIKLFFVKGAVAVLALLFFVVRQAWRVASFDDISTVMVAVG
jgi:hypothetical protein